VIAHSASFIVRRCLLPFGCHSSADSTIQWCACTIVFTNYDGAVAAAGAAADASVQRMAGVDAACSHCLNRTGYWQ
jgi:hypothetical protein